jgi:hypothetical protein
MIEHDQELRDLAKLAKLKPKPQKTTMNALTSYLRHAIVTVLLFTVEKLHLPIEGAPAAADIIALTLVGTISWAFVKYIAPKIKLPL